MGIESDQLVFDYLSRVGDLAHGTSMTAAERARLVTGLRGEIDRMRAEEGGAESQAAVRKILSRLGKPEELVSAAAGGAGVPEQRLWGDDAGPTGAGGERSRRLPGIPRLPPMRKPRGPDETPPGRQGGASPPHLAGMDELGPEESDPDWWRTDPSPYGRGSAGAGGRPGGNIVPGFVGGIEVPEVLKPPPGDNEPRIAGPTATRPSLDKATTVAGPGTSAGDTVAGAGGRRFRLRHRPPAGPRAGGVVELAAAGLLVTGAVMGSLIPLGLGWLAAYWSPRLTRVEAKWAALGMPALTVSGAVVWLWGRTQDHWGEPLAQGGEAMRAALSDTWPVALRGAAVASALFLLWRARRPAA